MPPAVLGVMKKWQQTIMLAVALALQYMLNMETKERTWSNPLLDINNSFVKAGEKHEQITAASLTPFKRTALPMER